MSVLFQRNVVTGQYLKGSEPFNKGKSWDDWMPKRKRKKVLKCLEAGRCKKGEPAPCAGWNARKVVFFDKAGNPKILPSAEAAGRMLNAPGRNIRLCCDGKRKRVHGVTFYWFDNDDWVVVAREIENERINA